MNEDIIPQYKVTKQNYSSEEKFLLGEIRENLVDLAYLVMHTRGVKRSY